MPFACWTCDETFRSKREVLLHCTIYQHTRAWVCEHCYRPFGSERAREQHTEDKHEFWCFPCDQVFDTEDALDLHNTTHHYFPCGFGCNRTFTSLQARDQHNNDVHSYRCYDCDQIFSSKQAFDQHEAANHDFKCEPCEREFRSESALDQHNNSSAHPYRCSKCSKSFPYNSDLRLHIAEEHNWKCTQCNLTFDGPNHLSLHKKSEHQVTQCIICRAKFDLTTELYLHKAQQHSFQCEYCTAPPFETWASLKKHDSSWHNFKCTGCPANFKREADQSIHVQNVHVHTCSRCGVRFDTSSLLDDHQLSHRVVCSDCQGSFDSIAAYDLHYAQAHRLCCPKCPMVFSNVGKILRHAFEHTKPITPADSVPSKEADFEKTVMDHHKLKYGYNTCKRCGGMFLGPLDLENHLANDHGLQLECSKPDCHHRATTPFGFALHYLSCSMVKCKKCEGSLYRDKDPELKAHMAESHSPKLIFGCVQCTRTFQSSDAVAQHYSAEHAFICEACPGNFFINSATRERYFATCGNTSETSDSCESFQTSRTEFSPLMQKKHLPALKICSPSAQAQVQVHQELFSPALPLPLTQSTLELKINRRNAVERLAQRILDEANAQSKLTYGSEKCNVFFPQVEEEEEL